MHSGSDVSLFLDPLTDRFEGDRLFGTHPYGDYNAPYRHVKTVFEARGIAVHTGDFLVRGESTSAVNLYVSTGLRSRYRQLAQRDDVVLSAFFVQECPIAEPALFADLDKVDAAFERMYAFSGDDALRPFLRRPLTFRPFRYPYPFDSVDEDAWERGERGFLVMINANKIPRLKTAELYTERMRAVAHFGRTREIDLYGFGWDGPSFRIGESRVPRPLNRLAYLAERRWHRMRPNRNPLLAAARRAYRGEAVSKYETLSRYTFSICFENMVLEGWVTEKLFDCLVAGTIPVYLGAPDVERWVDPQCFVDMRRFSGYDELREYLRSLGPDEIAAYREAGREYLRSERFRPFTKQAFAEIFARIAAEDAGVTV